MSLQIILIALFGLVAFIYLLVDLLPMLALRNWRKPELNSRFPISILICARNEEENLKILIPGLFSQNYPAFEVIVVNDASWDGTTELLEEMQLAHPNLVIVQISEEQKRTEGKKMALTLAIKRAKYEHLLLTDADCIPASTDWISEMGLGLEQGLVLGYGAYFKETGFLNKLIRFDTWKSASHFLGSALRGRPYIGVGRNLGYTKEVYESAGGFKKHYHIMSGDDDLLVNQIAQKENTAVSLDSNSFTYTKAPKKWSSWMRKKIRHLSSSKLYRPATKNRFMILNGFQVLFYLLLVLCLAFGCSILEVFVIFLAKTLIQMLISMPAMRRLKETDLLVLLPILEPLNLVINGLATIRMRWSKTIPWK